MAGGSSIPYGNVKNLFILSCTPSGPNVGATSITLATGGAVVTVAVPGVLLGDVVFDCNRPSNTINGNTAPAAPWVSVANAYISANSVLSIVLSNTSTLATTVPIEVYGIAVGRPDTPNPPSTTPTGIYS
jgi:hypothetical protein